MFSLSGSTKSFLLGVLLTGLACVVAACSPAAAPAASKAISRSVIENGGIVPADELRVAEYLSYYKQSFPEPTDRALGLDLRLGNGEIPASGGEAWLQIGLKARSTETEEIAPLNLALVIDRSGSMDAPEKMPYLKQSLRVFLQNLAAEDIVSVVIYSEDAEVVEPARKVGDGHWIESCVEKLVPRGSTNLHAGLMLGFQEVDSNFDIRRNNRVILLTDGIANRGVTDADQIAADALAYNQKGIYLSTIGLGHQFNDKLLSQLAYQGKGGYHFIDSAAEMDKVFRQEVTGLIQKAASDVSVVLEPEQGVRVLSITGYEGRPPAGAVQIRLRDMGTGDDQVVLVRLEIGDGRRTTEGRQADPGVRGAEVHGSVRSTPGE